MKQNVALSILTPFSSKSAKKWEGAAQKTKLDEGGPRGGLEITILCYYLSFVHFFTNVEAKVHVSEVKESIFQGFEKIQPFVFSKTLVLPQIKPWGRFCGCVRNPFNFLCFVYVEWKIDHSEVHSENLSTLHLSVWPWQPHVYNTKLYHRFTQGSMNFCSYTFQWRTFWLQINRWHDHTKRNSVLKFSE